MRERWRSATDTAWYELSPASPERLGEAAWGCSGLSLNGRNCVRTHHGTHAHAAASRSATSATRTPTVTVRSAAFTMINIRPLTSLRPRIKYNTRRPRRAAHSSAPGPAPIGIHGNWSMEAARARALGAGCVRFTVRGLGSAWSGHAAVRAPTRCFRRQAHGHGGHARRRAQQITRHRATQLSVSQTRDTHSTHSVRTAQQCSMCRMSNTARSPGSRVEFGSQKLARNGPARGMAANAHKRGCLHRRGRMLRMLTDVTEWYTTSFARVPCCCLLAW